MLTKQKQQLQLKLKLKQKLQPQTNLAREATTVGPWRNRIKAAEELHQIGFFLFNFVKRMHLFGKLQTQSWYKPKSTLRSCVMASYIEVIQWMVVCHIAWQLMVLHPEKKQVFIQISTDKYLNTTHINSVCRHNNLTDVCVSTTFCTGDCRSLCDYFYGIHAILTCILYMISWVVNYSLFWLRILTYSE